MFAGNGTRYLIYYNYDQITLITKSIDFLNDQIVWNCSTGPNVSRVSKIENDFLHFWN